MTKTSTTQKYASASPTAASDASKVTSQGTGLTRAVPMKEANFTVDCNNAGQSKII